MSVRRTRGPVDERMPDWGVSAFESHHAPDFSMGWRKHAFVKLKYALAGRGTLQIEDESIPFAAGDLLVAPAGCRNRLVDQPGDPVSVYVLCIAPKVLAFDPGIWERLKAGRHALAPALADRAQSLFRRLVFAPRTGGGATRLATVLAALEVVEVALEAIESAPTRSPVGDGGDPEMRRYLERLDQRFFEAGGLDEAAASLGVSRRAFSERFRAVAGESWLVYAKRKAIEHACRLISETDKPIAAVAFECGFGDLSAFYRRFKREVGEAPAAWRSRVRRGEFSKHSRRRDAAGSLKN